MKRFKEWLIRRLGGYTYDEMVREVTQHAQYDLQLLYLSNSCPSLEWHSAMQFADKRLKKRVHEHFTYLIDYRGNKPRR